MKNIRMIVSYDGTRYNGFQTQPSGNTIQDILESAIKVLTKEEIRIIGSGRTDAGVHARGQVLNFQTNSRIPAERWTLAINARLPEDIVVLRTDEVSAEFHSRHSAKRKTYQYTIDTNQFPDVFTRRYRVHHYAPLDVSAMRDVLAALVGEHDFTSFASPQSTQPSHIRTIYEAELVVGDGRLDIFVTGNGFLYNMVRIIAGTAIWVGEGKMEAKDIPAILASKDRTKAGPTAPPQGLTLLHVEYPE
ncbi:tRNA pseudouridine(38-40) synthase TruA [Paenibacillus mendelii]|uniref:tRNA pseudouridine synthase A n=1 Tax=Paenibacillus mendelii TaxID=206163 RepID=A0ABV6JG96_9BACL|nr:tRNA pseudouridine(38-40) synthase TruA [Paenibacillus mendelii]MCQ6563677.1 tRNA pseudouridine(38-40) synthase TruA [Paenibacillus mendelii]